ncbi:MAG: Mov34/MPN/PAD-1 family protein [Bacteroidetes bacterium]|nr:Mov34/MPN/PAD-1 family protein [Bacteroidota bacterium]
MNFKLIRNIRIPDSCIAEAYKHIRLAGLKRLEGVVLFAGSYHEGEFMFEVKETIVPKQLSVSLEDGLLYAVDGDELHRINVYLHMSGQTLLAQLHSHPTEAYHSLTDDAYPIVTKVGALSIVVPNFGMEEFALDKWAVYRLDDEANWEELAVEDVKKLITVI